MKTLPQIAFDFAADKNARENEPGPSSSPVQPTQHEQTAGVGVRLKHTKKEQENAALENTGSESAEMETTEGPGRIENAEAEGAGTAAEGMVIEATFLAISPVERSEGSAPEKTKSTRGRKSLKQIGVEADLIEIPGDDELFSKQYYTMGEVAAMFRVNQSLLRFWEAEFDILKPRKNKKGDRHFRPIDIKNLHLIYNLLRQRKYTIEGAKEFLKGSKKAEARFEAIRRLQEIRAFLLELKAQI